MLVVEPPPRPSRRTQAAGSPGAGRCVRLQAASWLPRTKRQKPTARAAFIDTK